MRLAVVLVTVFVLPACGERPVTCTDYTTKAGSRPSLTTFDKAVNGHTWSKCSDGKTRSVTCTPGHFSAWKCMCTIDGVDKIESRRETDVVDERAAATADVNRMCHWKLQ